jgi:hypothetical protein
MVLCCASVAVLAAPPFRKAPHSASATASAAHLDLRLPAAHEFTAVGAPRWMNDASRVAEPEGSAGRPPQRSFGPASADHPGDTSSDERSLGGLRVGMTQGRSWSGAEAFARRVHREGLPVARLWENHSALVSLGLNQKGKPGLWLVQKTH